MAAILALIQEFLALPGQVTALMEEVKALRADFKKASDQVWANQTNKTLNEDLAAAKSPEEFQKVAKDLQDEIGKL